MIVNVLNAGSVNSEPAFNPNRIYKGVQHQENHFVEVSKKISSECKYLHSFRRNLHF